MVYTDMRYEANKNDLSMTKVIGSLEASICLVNKNKNTIMIDYPTKKIKEIRNKLNLSDSQNEKLDNYFSNKSLL